MDPELERAIRMAEWRMLWAKVQPFTSEELQAVRKYVSAEMMEVLGKLAAHNPWHGRQPREALERLSQQQLLRRAAVLGTLSRLYPRAQEERQRLIVGHRAEGITRGLGLRFNACWNFYELLTIPLRLRIVLS